MFAAVFVAPVALLIIFLAGLLLAGGSWGLGLFLAALGVFIAGLLGYVVRDLRGRWGLRVLLYDDHVTLELPAGRSLVHRPARQQLAIPYDAIEAVETRLEAYPFLGLANMQRPFVLHLKNDERIFLFEDRALGTALEQPIFAPMAQAIVDRAHVPLRDLGMVEGQGGVLCVWGTHAPEWAAPSLPMAQQLRLWRHAAATASLGLVLVMASLAIAALR
jgi:hypothetical protein